MEVGDLTTQGTHVPKTDKTSIDVRVTDLGKNLGSSTIFL